LDPPRPGLAVAESLVVRRIPSTGCVPIVDCLGIADNRVDCRGGLSSECAGGVWFNILSCSPSGMTTSFMAISKAVPSSHFEFHDSLEKETHADVFWLSPRPVAKTVRRLELGTILQAITSSCL